MFIWYYYTIYFFFVSFWFHNVKFTFNERIFSNSSVSFFLLSLVSQMDWRHFFASFMFDCLVFFYSRLFYQHKLRGTRNTNRLMSEIRAFVYKLYVKLSSHTTVSCQIAHDVNIDMFRLFSVFLCNIDSLGYVLRALHTSTQIIINF